MNYFDPATVRDSLLANLLTPEDRADADNYINDLATSFAVDPATIPEPAPYKVQQLAMCYALMICAGNNSLMNGDGGTAGADAYELKRRNYAAEVSRLEKLMTAEAFGGGVAKQKRFPYSIPLRRG